MVNYPAPRYPGGTMLTVIRTGTANARDWQGDLVAAAETEHQIGPCDLKWLTDSEDNTSGEQLTLTARVTAPVGSDVLDGDRIRLPDGRVFVIDGQVRLAPNGFTGWVAGVRFVIAKDGGSGVRRQ
ncbi:hypothetical protein [Nocardia thailandica]|uniref:hypothetical protein n=1 Tax=Nocardia thailandica TaxID=257275 RepID=UPI0012F801F2|nr:hypothetical protein [Nocardia thailandica]